MKQNLRIVMALFVLLNVQLNTNAQTFDSQNVNLLSHWDDTTITTNTSWVANRYNSCWGWTNPVDNRNYAIIGSQLGTHIIDITNPSSPVQADFVAGRRSDVVWREYKTYQHYLYMCSDDAAPNSFQIADLSYLPDSVHVVYDNDSLITRSHTIFIDNDKLYCGIPKKGGSSKSLGVYSLANPEVPVLLRYLTTDYPAIGQVHDMLVINDTVYASCGNDGLHVYRYDAVANQFTQLDFLNLTGNYNHSSAVTDDRSTLYYCEEVPAAQNIATVDITNISNISFLNGFQSNVGATPHNPYIKGNLLYVAYYQDGLQVFDISDRNNVTRVGFFDTFYDNVGGYLAQDYQGAWAAYPWMPNNMVLVSDMQHGLFVIDDSPLSIGQENAKESLIQVYPNPATDAVKIKLTNQFEKMSVRIYNALGENVFSSDAVGQLNVSVGAYANGLYTIYVQTENKNLHQQLSILHR